MADVNTILAANREATGELIAAAEKTGSAWSTPPAPGRWSPSQVVEHVARALEESANVVAGAPSKFPTMPGPVRPLMRIVFFNTIVRTRAFPKAKTSRPLDPERGPATLAEGRARLDGAREKFDQACAARAGQRVESTIFGRVSVEDYATFQEIHTRHHARQVAGMRLG